MRMTEMDIHIDNQLVADYRAYKTEAMQFFDYPPFDSLKTRVEELKNRSFQRNALADILTAVNKKWGAKDPTLHNIEKLRKKETVAVVGGQQAGLLTGPLYSLNKVISIIQFAKTQEDQLGVPVVPIFWIAGEDHDFQEINHVYMPGSESLKKVKLKQSLYKKTPVSEIELDQNVAQDWLDGLFSSLDETEHTKKLYEGMKVKLQQSTTFTDFFARIILELFPDEGVILIDSQQEEIRQLESGYFKEMIEKQEEISASVVETADALQASNYTLNLEVSLTDGHLFVHDDGERILLERTASGNWKGKQNEIEYSPDEMLEIADKQPEKLSNNVVTRPLMQEMLLPTLAFIGGPGEISYWAVLKQAFHLLEVKMPPVVPRISYTYISAKVEQVLRERNIDLHTAITTGVTEEKEKWLKNKQDPEIEVVAEHLKEKIKEAHQRIQSIAEELRADMNKLAQKNLFYLQREVDFLSDRMMQALEMKYQKQLRQFDLLQLTLRPDGGLQERMWNPLPLLNQYGNTFIKKVTLHPVSFEKNHYVVHL